MTLPSLRLATLSACAAVALPAARAPAQGIVVPVSARADATASTTVSGVPDWSDQRSALGATLPSTAPAPLLSRETAGPAGLARVNVTAAATAAPLTAHRSSINVALSVDLYAAADPWTFQSADGSTTTGSSGAGLVSGSVEFTFALTKRARLDTSGQWVPWGSIRVQTHQIFPQPPIGTGLGLGALTILRGASPTATLNGSAFYPNVVSGTTGFYGPLVLPPDTYTVRLTASARGAATSGPAGPGPRSAVGVAPLFAGTFVEVCPCDWDGDGVIGTADVSNYLIAWFSDRTAGTVDADYNADGVTDSNDLTSFVAAWFQTRATGTCW